MAIVQALYFVCQEIQQKELLLGFNPSKLIELFEGILYIIELNELFMRWLFMLGFIFVLLK